MKLKTEALVECALMIAISTVLSFVKIDWLLGGGITIASMLPLVIIAHRYGTRTGVIAAFVYGVLQMVLGLDNVQYATSFFMAVAIALLDYILAYAVIGLSAVFDGKIRNRLASIVAGISMTFFLRFVCHFLSGWFVWEALWPNARGWAAPVWSLAYNAAYMAPETAISIAAACLLYKPLRRYWDRVE